VEFLGAAGATGGFRGHGVLPGKPWRASAGDQRGEPVRAPAYQTLQYPNFAPAIGWRGSIGMSAYNGLSVAMRRSFSRGLLVTANYMWSHEIDNGSNGSGDGDEVSPQNAMCAGLRSSQRHLGRPPCGQCQCGLSAPVRHGQADAERARNCKQPCGQLGGDHDGAGSHRLPR